MIVDVHTHGPTHKDEVPAAERKTYSGWHSGPPVNTTNSWVDYEKGMEAADVAFVFNIHVPDTDRFVGTPDDKDRMIQSMNSPKSTHIELDSFL
jgi:hypothetical protein